MGARNEAMKKRKKLMELLPKKSKARKAKTILKEVKALPTTYAPTREQLEAAARRVPGVKYENGRFVGKGGRLTKREYEEVKNALRDEMGLKGKPLTAGETLILGMVEKAFPKEYKKYKQGKYKTVGEASDEGLLKMFYPKEYKKYLKGRYKTITEALDVGYLKEDYPIEYIKYKLGKYRTSEEALDTAKLKRNTAEAKRNFPKEYEEYKQGKYKTLQKAIDASDLKSVFPEEYKELQRLIKEKGLTPEGALEMLKDFEEKQAAKRKKKESSS